MPRAELDDERFVHKFVVEGRPKQLVVEVLTEEVRDAIAQIEPTAVDVRNGTVTVKKLFVYYFAEPQMTAAAMGLVAQLVQNLATAVPKLFELVETVENVSGGALVPYREDRQVTTHSRRLKGEYVEELVPFQRTRQLRKLSRPYTTAIMSGLLIVVWVAEFLCGRA
jgi:hypothetical protein